MNQKKLRDYIIAPKGKVILMFDLSQAETWVVAYLAKEESMKLALKKGIIHEQTAADVIFHVPIEQITKEMRYLGKRANHALDYGMSGNRFAQVVNKDSDKPPYITISIKQGNQYHDGWHMYYHIRDWWYEIQGQLDKDRTLTNPYGRKSTFYGNLSNPYERHELHKQGYSWIPQSTVADHFTGNVQKELNIQGGLKQIYKKIIFPSKGEIECFNMSHDSAALYVPIKLLDEVTEQCIETMTRPLIINNEEFTIPVDAEIGERYGSLEKWKKH